MNDTIRKAEACRHSADQARQKADKAHTGDEREAFQRLADGYDVLARQLEKIAERPADRPDGKTWLLSSPRSGRIEH